jgi:hypothetical protein
MLFNALVCECHGTPSKIIEQRSLAMADYPGYRNHNQRLQPVQRPLMVAVEPAQTATYLWKKDTPPAVPELSVR